MSDEVRKKCKQSVFVLLTLFLYLSFKKNRETFLTMHHCFFRPNSLSTIIVMAASPLTLQAGP